jgi:hypothetical protein
MTRHVLGALCFVLCAGAVSPVHAEIVFLTSGRTVNVASHRIDGDTIVLALRSGSEMAMPVALVARIANDEVPWVPPVPLVPPGSVLQVPPVQRVQTVRSEPAVPARAPAYEDLIAQAAAEHDVDPALVRAVIKVESSYRPDARSQKGAMGLMQLMPATAREYGVEDAYDPGENIDAGVRHLRSLLDRFDVPLAIAAYNAGEGAVRRHKGVPPYKETREYVRKVLRLAGR